MLPRSRRSSRPSQPPPCLPVEPSPTRPRARPSSPAKSDAAPAAADGLDTRPTSRRATARTWAARSTPSTTPSTTPSVDRLRHVVHVHDERLARPVSALSSRRHSTTARRGSLAPPLAASRAAPVVVLLAALALAGRRLWRRQCEAAGDDAPGRVVHRPGVARPGRPEGDGLRDRPAQRLGVRVRRARAALGDDLGGHEPRQRRRVSDPARRRRAGQGDQRRQGPARAALARRPAVRHVARPGGRLQRPARHALRDAQGR